MLIEGQAPLQVSCLYVLICRIDVRIIANNDAEVCGAAHHWCLGFPHDRT